ncbi:MAG: hypothetical protein HFP77_01965 [Methylococcales symbiont of Iophon sp. n. MRB-2018]|nr:MAG: hypothetical protein HFP77_01965 [Methylococcales symbiont of Iophon sp. n. MRB-2018]KAF3980493.1 MAG: hypothetical protein HFP76_01770 [Methylococcales symbiont of Iophon sp. n. MRB-2018]
MPDYIQYLTDADTANDAMHRLPKDHQNRDQFYQQCTPHIAVLKKVVDNLDRAMPFIETKTQTKEYTDKKTSRRFQIQILIGIFAIIVAIAIATIVKS